MSIPQKVKAVVVHAGNRDRYQLPIALHEGNLLEAFITDVYSKRIPSRHSPQLKGARVITPWKSASLSILARSPIGAFQRRKDKALSQAARSHAGCRGNPVVSTTYYATEVFKEGANRPERRLLFILQAEPRTLKELLGSEASSSDYELALPPNEYEKLVAEPYLANEWIATSSFAAHTYAKRGIPAERIAIVPYGVDNGTYPARGTDPSGDFSIVYVGSVIPRKGISYLLEAYRRIKGRGVRLTIITRGSMDHSLLMGHQNVQIKQGLSGSVLASELHKADLFVFPSLAEGFAHVILEAMSCGLPVITTPNTCGPDVVREGEDGFLVPIRDADSVAEKLVWGIGNRPELAEMGRSAASRAREFTWERFRAGVRNAYCQML